MTLAEIKLSEQVVKRKKKLPFFNKFDQGNYHKTAIEGKR